MCSSLDLLAATPLADRPRALYSRKADWFFGPKSDFRVAVEKSDPSVPPFVDALKPLISGDKDEAKLKCLMHLANLHGAGGTFSAPDLVVVFDILVPKMTSACPLPSEVTVYEAAIDTLRIKFSYNIPILHTWTGAQWQLVTCVRDALSTGADILECERTPIFLATKQGVGRVLWLVAERLPGPNLVTPNWWKLGLVPLGANNQLLNAIHHGFEQVLATVNKNSDDRFQLRWWLEEFPAGGGWHADIDQADSAQVAAACVARALTERDVIRPLLDPCVGVSATLPEIELQWRHTLDDLHQRIVGGVTMEQAKTSAAKAAKLLTILFETETARRVTATDIRVQGIRTFDDAYQSLLATTTVFQNQKLSDCAKWDLGHHEKETSEEYIKLFEK